MTYATYSSSMITFIERLCRRFFFFFWWRFASRASTEIRTETQWRSRFGRKIITMTTCVRARITSVGEVSGRAHVRLYIYIYIRVYEYNTGSRYLTCSYISIYVCALVYIVLKLSLTGRFLLYCRAFSPALDRY